MGSDNIRNPKPTGLFRVIEKGWSPKEKYAAAREDECTEIFDHGDGIEQMYHDANPNALTGECWIDETDNPPSLNTKAM